MQPIKQDVFILGSGFSKDIADFPLLGELSKKVFDHIKSELKNSSDQLLNSYITNEIPSLIKENVEHFLTYLSQNYPWRNNRENHLFKAAYQLTSEAIEKIFVQYEKDNIGLLYKNGKFENIKKLITHWRNQNQQSLLSIMTH